MLQDPSRLQYYILYIGPEWKDRKMRLNKENELILSYLSQEVYNFHPLSKTIKNENYRIICKINGIQYQSVAEASRLTKESETRIRTKLNSNFIGYKIIKKIKNGYEPIIVNGKLYESILSPVEAGEAKDRFQAMRRLKSLKHKNWNYQSKDKVIDKSSNNK